MKDDQDRGYLLGTFRFDVTISGDSHDELHQTADYLERLLNSCYNVEHALQSSANRAPLRFEETPSGIVIDGRPETIKESMIRTMMYDH